MTYLLDSVIFIDHFNGVSPGTEFLLRHAQDAAITVITRAEVLAGAASSRDAVVIALLLSRFPCLGIDTATADLAASLRREHRWKLPDAFQAAIAQHNSMKFVTRNTRDFPPGVFDFVLVPYSV